MDVLVVLLLLGAVAAAVAWWVRSAGRRPDGPEGSLPLGPEPEPDAPGPGIGNGGFVLAPSPPADDRPPRLTSTLRLAAAVTAVALVAAGAVWVLGFLVNLQLARLLGE